MNRRHVQNIETHTGDVGQPVDHIFACDSLSDDEKRAILGETAAKLLNIRI